MYGTKLFAGILGSAMLDLRRITSPLSIANIPWCLLHAGDDFTLTQLLSYHLQGATRDHSRQWWVGMDVLPQLQHYHFYSL